MKKTTLLRISSSRIAQLAASLPDNVSDKEFELLSDELVIRKNIVLELQSILERITGVKYHTPCISDIQESEIAKPAESKEEPIKSWDEVTLAPSYPYPTVCIQCGIDHDRCEDCKVCPECELLHHKTVLCSDFAAELKEINEERIKISTNLERRYK